MAGGESSAAKRRRTDEDEEVPPIPSKTSTGAVVAKWLNYKCPEQGYGDTFKKESIDGEALHLMVTHPQFREQYKRYGVKDGDWMKICNALGCAAGAAAAAGAAPAAAAAAAAAVWQEVMDVASFAMELVKDTEVHDHDLELSKVSSKGFAGDPMDYPKDEHGNVLLFFRKEVRQLVVRIVSEQKPWSAMIGTPGIGKSSALYYQLRTVLKMGGKQTVLLEHRGRMKVFRFEQAAGGKISAFVISLMHWDPDSCPYTQDTKNWRLIDPKKGQGGNKASWTCDMHARTTIACSPNIRSHAPMEDLWKEGTAYADGNYYLPVWDKESLKVASLLNHEFAKGKQKSAREAEFEMMYYDFGGIPRHVWSAMPEDIRTSRMEALNCSGVFEMAKSMLLGERFQMQDKDSVLHKLFAIRVSDKFKKDKTMPVSRKAAELLACKYWKELTGHLKAGYYVSAAESGIFFEAIAHEWLANGGKFLDVLGKSFTIMQQRTVLVDGADEEFLGKFAEGTEGYMKPTYQRLACVDSADAGANRVYEITVAEEKSIKTDHIDKYIAQRPNKAMPLEFVRVIPTFRAPGKEKPFKTRIKQHPKYRDNEAITESVIVLGPSC